MHSQKSISKKSISFLVSLLLLLVPSIVNAPSANADTAVAATHAIANSTPTKINVTFDVNATGLVDGDFAVTKGATVVTVTAVETDPKNYVLTLASAAVSSDVFTVTVTKTGFSFTGTSVTNNVAAPATAGTPLVGTAQP